ncbi:lipopolysaccharide biosynthesis protein [Yoonia litorea]|uniref:Membrane protein involved in the export of O-antigen and teichoic acid n=1 Tax=Yoonia litorea TaxID=1123755 RepID=A0A1I6LDS8_9RHOB|nr:hypothetical protein [Yoonia litorea]SFS01599.1 Membrane protein involved in the export of O-antigen and teichoic acid [Yoonia litorea]
MFQFWNQHWKFGKAASLLALRAGIIGINLAVMVSLAWWLGLANFGELVHLWAIALIGTTIVGAGAPLIILRMAPDDLHQQFLAVCFVTPALLCIIGWVVMSSLFPNTDWGAVLTLAFALHLLQCLAAAMRVTGDAVFSMALRDGLPVVVLLFAALLSESADIAILFTALMLLGFGVSALCVVYGIQGAKGGSSADRDPRFQLWLSSVLGMAQGQIDLVLAGALLPPEIFGGYALLRRLSNVVALPVSVATWATAPQVAEALRQGDRTALQSASSTGSQIAWFPALGICLLCLCGLGLGWAADVSILTDGGWLMACVMLLGAVMHSYWAASYTVANLAPSPSDGVRARAMSLVIYGGGVALGGAALSALGHAVVFAAATGLSSLFLWHRLNRLYGVDTSAGALWARKKEIAWRMS